MEDWTETRSAGCSARSSPSSSRVREGAATRAGRSPRSEAPAYARPLAPGSVVRCIACEAVLAVVVEAEGRIRLGLRGFTWLEVEP